MRTDVKIGVLLSLVVVVSAGWYYLRKDSSRETVSLDGPIVALNDNKPPERKPPEIVMRRSEPTVDERKPEVRRSRTRPTIDQPAEPPVENPKPSEDDTSVASLGPAQPEQFPLGIDDPAPDRPVRPADSDDSDQTSVLPDPGPAVGLQDGSLTATAPPSTTPTRTIPNLGPPQQPTPEAVSQKMRTHKVEAGDTLSLLAEIYLGSQIHTNVLLEANPQLKNPDRLLVGTVLNVPDLDAAGKAALSRKPASKPAATPQAGTYLVKEGDTLYGIADRELGSGARWKELFELNRDLMKGDPDNLKAGQMIKLPDGKKST